MSNIDCPLRFAYPLIMLLLNTLYLLCLIVWIGSLIFFSFVGAPSIFKTLPIEEAGKVVGAIFPKYYPLGYVSGFIALACLLWNSARSGVWSPLKMFLLVIMLALTLFSSINIHPRARALKEEIQAASDTVEATQLKAEFDRVHRLSVVYNGLVLLLGIVLTLVTAKNLTL